VRRLAQTALALAFLGWSALVVLFTVHVWLHGTGGDKAFATVLALPLLALGATVLSLLFDDVGERPYYRSL
jgi:hypothetical protein